MGQKKLSGLSQSSSKKKQEALEKTERAIARLVDNKDKITIRSVAREAGVSVSYIYKYPELSYKIQRLREQQKYSLVASDRQIKKDNIAPEELRLKITELTQENQELKGIIEQVKSGKNSLRELRSENIQLAQENIRLQRELEYAQQNLQSARQFILEQGRLELEQEENESEIKRIRQVSKE